MSKPDVIDALARFFDRSREEILAMRDEELGGLHTLRTEYLAEQAAVAPAESEPVTVRVATERHWHGTDETVIEAADLEAAAHWDIRPWKPGRP